MELFRRKMNEAEQINRLKGCGCQKTAAKDGFLGGAGDIILGEKS